jgi:hypothetical protein
MADDNVFDAVVEKHEKKKEQAKSKRQEFEESVEKGEKLLQVERTPSGLYYVYFKGGGQLPFELHGKFTSIDALRRNVINKYGKDILA